MLPNVKVPPKIGLDSYFILEKNKGSEPLGFEFFCNFVSMFPYFF